MDLCEIAIDHKLDGHSLRNLLEDDAKQINEPTITIHGPGNFSVRDERYRYIRYQDGTEELYDHEQDPHEWTNQANNPEFNDIKQRLVTYIPEQFAEEVEPYSNFQFKTESYQWVRK